MRRRLRRGLRTTRFFSTGQSAGRDSRHCCCPSRRGRRRGRAGGRPGGGRYRRASRRVWTWARRGRAAASASRQRPRLGPRCVPAVRRAAARAGCHGSRPRWRRVRRSGAGHRPRSPSRCCRRFRGAGADPRERYYAPSTIKKSGTLRLTKGHALYSDRGRPLFTIMADSCGHHDTIAGCCSAPSNAMLYGVEGVPGCRENFLAALAEHGLGWTTTQIWGMFWLAS